MNPVGGFTPVPYHPFGHGEDAAVRSRAAGERKTGFCGLAEELPGVLARLGWATYRAVRRWTAADGVGVTEYRAWPNTWPAEINLAPQVSPAAARNQRRQSDDHRSKGIGSSLDPVPSPDGQRRSEFFSGKAQASGCSGAPEDRGLAPCRKRNMPFSRISIRYGVA